MVSVLNTLGVGSGVDTTALIDALVKAEHDPREAALTARSAKVEARISGLSQVKSGLSALTTALAARTHGGALGPLPGSSDTSVVAASATNGATPLLSPVELEVKTLAGGQTLVSGSLAGSSAPVGKGVLTLRSGTMTPDGLGGFGFAGSAAAPVEVTIDATNDNLTGLRDAINAAQTGRADAVQASVIADGSGARLVLKGPSGASSAFVVTADGDPGLARFVHQPGTSAMTAATSARDASVVVDGVAVTRPTNNFSDLIDGVTLDLRRAAPGTTVTIAATRDADGLKTATRDLVAALGELNTLTAGLVKAGNDSGDAGALAGDGTMRRLRGQLASLTSAPVATGSAKVTRLADLGVTTLRDGSLAIDDARLAAAVASAPDAVEKLLAGLTAGASGPLTTIAATLGGTGASAVDSRYVREQTVIARDRTDLDARMTTYRAMLVKQYAAMESAVAASKATMSFLDAQIKAWNQTTN